MSTSDGSGASGDPRRAGPVVVGVLAGIAHLVPGFFIVVSGLVAPFWAIFFMLVVWIALGIALVRMMRRGSWWTPVVPVAAMAFWFGFITLGERLLGWTA